MSTIYRAGGRPNPCKEIVAAIINPVATDQEVRKYLGELSETNVFEQWAQPLAQGMLEDIGGRPLLYMPVRGGGTDAGRPVEYALLRHHYKEKIPVESLPLCVDKDTGSVSEPTFEEISNTLAGLREGGAEPQIWLFDEIVRTGKTVLVPWYLLLRNGEQLGLQEPPHLAVYIDTKGITDRAALRPPKRLDRTEYIKNLRRRGEFPEPHFISDDLRKNECEEAADTTLFRAFGGLVEC